MAVADKTYIGLNTLRLVFFDFAIKLLKEWNRFLITCSGAEQSRPAVCIVVIDFICTNAVINLVKENCHCTGSVARFCRTKLINRMESNTLHSLVLKKMRIGTHKFNCF